MGAPETTLEQCVVDDARVRERQQLRLRALREELVAEGADASKYLEALRRRADSWPE